MFTYRVLWLLQSCLRLHLPSAFRKYLPGVTDSVEMGQLLRRMYELQTEAAYSDQPSHQQVMLKQFPDLSHLPPELGLLVLSHLNATDLCLAACVWQNLANDEILWHRYCEVHLLKKKLLAVVLANMVRGTGYLSRIVIGPFWQSVQ